MKQIINSILAAALVVTGVSAEAAVRTHSDTIIVESPAQLPALAQKNSEAMYLYDTNDGHSVLYIEEQGGHELSVLDVSDPSKIRAIAETPLAAAAAFDFVQNIGGNKSVIRYRDGSGAAVISFKNYKHPVLLNEPGMDRAYASEPIGQTGLLLTSAQLPADLAAATQTYKVLDITNPSQAGSLGTIPAVKQRLSKADTGTLFLLNSDGVTVVRQPLVEKQHQIELDLQWGN